MAKKVAKEKIPSVTQIIDILEKDWIIYWIKSKGFEFTEEIKRESQGIGHGVHKGIERFLKGKPFSEAVESLTNQEKVMLSRLTGWCNDNEIKPVLLETRLESKKYNFTGKPDAIATFNGGKSFVVVDWKTDSTPKTKAQDRERRVKYRYQAAGYSILYKEKYGVNVDKAVFVRVTKDEIPLLTPFWFDDIKAARTKFLQLRKIYKEIKGK